MNIKVYFFWLCVPGASTTPSLNAADDTDEKHAPKGNENSSMTLTDQPTRLLNGRQVCQVCLHLH